MIDQLELGALRFIRRHTGHPIAVRVAQLGGWFGEHALGWIVLGALIGLVDAGHRPVAFTVVVAAVTAHAAGIAVKRIVRRRRPPSDALAALCHTPSELSFPSAHACSTTAAALALVPIVGMPAAVVIIAAMGFSRLLLGVHYPTDILAGIAIGTGVAAAVAQLLGSA